MYPYGPVVANPARLQSATADLNPWAPGKLTLSFSLIGPRVELSPEPAHCSIAPDQPSGK